VIINGEEFAASSDEFDLDETPSKLLN